jgi:cyanophycin synthetase
MTSSLSSPIKVRTMKIVKQRFLRGPNLYASRPCLLSVLDLEDLDGVASNSVPGFVDALLALMPSLNRHRCSVGHPGGFVERLVDGTYMAHTVEHVALELQCLAGAPAGFGRTRKLAGAPRQYNVVCAYQLETVGAQAFQVAVDLAGVLAHSQPFDLAAPLAALKETAARRTIGTSTASTLDAARRRGIPIQRITEDANLFQLGWGSAQRRLQATMTGATSNIAVHMASNKHLTKTLLEQSGIPVPKGDIVTTLEAAQAAARRLRGPVTVKPLDANQGKGVTACSRTPEQVAAAYAHARAFGRRIIVEQFIEGADYRVLVTGTKIAAASMRLPPSVTGNGASTLRELVAVENANPARGEGHANILTKIALDDHAAGLVREQGHEFDAVLPAGVTVQLRSNANLSTGGTAEDVTDLLPESTRVLCVRAAQKIGLDIAGIDIVCRDIARPLKEQRGAVIEVNAAPGIRMHHYPSRGQPRDAGAAIVEAMFGAGDGRIPVVAVTGTNGKTTTTLMLAHGARLAGRATGVTTTEGIYLNGVEVVRGDCSRYWSARNVLGAPDIDFAVLETARGGILKRGLAFDRCDVGIVLNVTHDHLGMDGVETVKDLARVKNVVARGGKGGGPQCRRSALPGHGAHPAQGRRNAAVFHERRQSGLAAPPRRTGPRRVPGGRLRGARRRHAPPRAAESGRHAGGHGRPRALQHRQCAGRGCRHAGRRLYLAADYRLPVHVRVEQPQQPAARQPVRCPGCDRDCRLCAQPGRVRRAGRHGALDGAAKNRGGGSRPGRPARRRLAGSGRHVRAGVRHGLRVRIGDARARVWRHAGPDH